ncbi:YwpF-like protein [Bacillus sp. OV322]|uniref:YwpF family protein n=1 Tax=Bacillus sp. OV322 TaxID=1882764 RepID=UPI0008E46347|nr:YwpF family protein [Bacillus sp. OV322]SFC22483.1 YwpF-like protein [Bacillus sp. OV322]
MKTFKLISLQIADEKQELIEAELTDGLIINKEDDQSTWLLEALIENEQFKKIKDALPPVNGEVNIQAVITKKENDPASFKTILRIIKDLEGHKSIMFEGHLQRSRSKYAELLLEDLIQQGMTGEALVEQFKEKIRSRPKLTANK